MPSHSRSPIVLPSLFFLLLISAPSAQAQCGANMIGWGDVGVVPNNPFHSELVVTGPVVPDLLSNRRFSQPELVARDNQGRIRIERVGGEFKRDTPPDAGTKVEQHLIIICDPVAQTLIQIDTAAGTARIMHARQIASRTGLATAPRRPFCAARMLRQPLRGLTMEDLGDQIIEGLEAHGQRLTHLPPEPGDPPELQPLARTTERWCSDELSAIVLTVSEDPKTGKNTTRAMRNIERTEPDPQLFQIPPNYSVIESDFPATIHRDSNVTPAPANQP